MQTKQYVLTETDVLHSIAAFSMEALALSRQLACSPDCRDERDVKRLIECVGLISSYTSMLIPVAVIA